jgi:NitT/TauT family transport system ATP-binding protein
MGELVLSNVRKTFAAARGPRRCVLDGVDLTVTSGDFVVIVGPSGCGKSTLLRIIAGLTSPDPGGATLTIDGEPIVAPGPDRGVVFQQYHYYPWLSVLENIKFGLRFLPMPERDRVMKAEEQLQLVGLADYRDEYPAVLSGGQQQRVAIARALAAGPRVILMDEPFAALDAQTRESMQAELLQLQKRTASTIVFVTHDIAEAAFLGNRVHVLSRMPARIVASVDARATREKIFSALEAGSHRDLQDGRLDDTRGDWLRYDPHFLAIQRELKQALEGQQRPAPLHRAMPPG